MALKLYHTSRSRSARPLWLLEEAGAPYELVPIDTAKQEHKTPEYLRIHPHGVVPALVDGDLTLMESSAICMYLADKFPAAKLAPALGTPERGRYYQWMVYAIATLEPPVLQVFLHTVFLPEDKRSEARVAEGREQFAGVAKVLSDAVRGKPYLLGDQFTAADILIGSTLQWSMFLGLLADQPELAGYVERLSSRPAFQKAQSL